MLWSTFSKDFLKGYETAINTKNPPYYTPFNLNKRLTSILREAINLKVKPVFNIEQQYACTCAYADVVGKLVSKKSTHFGPVLLKNNSYKPL